MLGAGAAVAAGLAACGSEAPPALSCSPQNLPPPGTTEHRITSDGTERSYLLHIPPDYDGSTRFPVIFAFHGVGDQAGSFVSATGMDRLADRQGAIVVAPEGSGGLPAWSFRAEGDQPAADVSYVHELVDRVKDTTCVDERRVYAAGFSNGSTLVLSLACEPNRDFAAFGAVSGPYYTSRCDDAPARSIFYVHGAADLIIPFDGAKTILGDLPAVADALTDWAEHDECRRPASTTTVMPSVTQYRWTGCARGGDVQAYVVAGGAHTWPGWVTDRMWSFFADHALP